MSDFASLFPGRDVYPDGETMMMLSILLLALVAPGTPEAAAQPVATAFGATLLAAESTTCEMPADAFELVNQVVALEAEGSNPFSHPNLQPKRLTGAPGGAPRMAYYARKPSPSLRGSLLIAEAGVALDVGTTVYGLRRPGLEEINPLWAHGAGAVVISATMAGGIWAIHRSGHPRLARIVAWVVGGAHAAYAVHNVRTIRGQ